jgi:excisionase family DNA binding protein
MGKTLSVQEVARAVNVYEITIYRAIWNGRLQAIKNGRRLEISLTAFEAWNQSRGRWPKKQEKTTNEN